LCPPRIVFEMIPEFGTEMAHWIQVEDRQSVG
jgi:hypothetical protein